MEKSKNSLKGPETRIGFLRGSLLLAATLTLTLSLSSCHKKTQEQESPQTPQDTEQGTASDNTLAENNVADIESMGSQVAEAGTLSTYRGASIDLLEASTCAQVTISGQIVTVDFGTTGCLGRDGRVRTGKLIYNFSGSTSGATHYRNPGFNMSVTSQNYVVDTYTINIINKVVTNITPTTIPTTPNPGTNLKWSIAASISMIKPNNGGTVTWACSRTKELTNTSDTLCYRGQAVAIDWTKAVVKLNGSASGVNAKGENYTVVATNLVRDFNCAPDPLRPHCHPFISGTISYTPGSRATRLVDYGNGACDLNATVTINGHVFNVTLP